MNSEKQQAVAAREDKRTHIKGVELYCTSPDSHRHAERHGFSPITKEYTQVDWMVGIIENDRVVKADKQKRFFKEGIYDYIYIDNHKHQIE